MSNANKSFFWVFLLGILAAVAALMTAQPPSSRVKVNPKDGLEYVWIPAGTFQMGCVTGDKECLGYEKPQHPVEITKGFWMGRTEVSVEAYKRFVAATSRKMPEVPEFNPGWGKEDHPIVSVTWDEANDYCKWVGGRLPTEAEWEYAARGGKEDLKYPWGNEISKEHANYAENFQEALKALSDGPSPVGSYPANGFGLYDMTSNVREWCADWFGLHYASSPAQDPQGPPSGYYGRVLRGGSWLSDPDFLRASGRLRYLPDGGSFSLGFRCAREVSP